MCSTTLPRSSRPLSTTDYHSTSETHLSIPFLERDVVLKVDAGPGCGRIAWPAGEVLARYIAYRHSHSPDFLRNKTVLELGSGTGLVGIVAAMLEPTADIWVTDQKQLLGLMEINVSTNTVTPNIHVAELNWGEVIPDDIRSNETSLILAADCVYFEERF